jgi:predicted glycoside hydrolase/deacetylase ChbG (UPF0249 family)
MRVDLFVECFAEGTSELICHPGYVDSQLANMGTRLLSRREAEARALMWSQPKQLALDEGIQLISFHGFTGETLA